MMTSPVAAAIELVRVDAEEATVAVQVDASEPVLTGHYPGFPIFPGVCVIECVHRGSMATAPESGTELAAVESSRFLGPVFPGDRLTVDITWRRMDDAWRSTAKVRSDRGTVATVRLRYRIGADS